MKLRQFRITNHSRLQDVELDVRNHLLLVGPNDTGKSSVLRCLDLLLGASTAQMYSRISATDFRDPLLPFVVEARFTDLDDDDAALFPDEADVDMVSNHTSLTVQLEASLDVNGTIDIRRYSPGAHASRQLSREQLLGMSWRTIGASSRARDVYDDRNAVLDDILSGIDLGAEQATFDAIVTDMRSALGDSAVLATLREQLATQLTRALPEVVSPADLAFVPGGRADAPALGDVRLQVTRSGQTRALTEQSDGTRALFAIALYDLASVSTNIVAIDEPEIHLHPTSQRSLARLLSLGDNQKIIATHSADIVGVFPADHVVAVKWGGHIVQPQAGFLSEDEKTRLRWWIHNRLEPLTANKILAFEGVADRIVLQAAAEITGRDLDRLGVSMLAADGAGDMKAIITLFGNTGFDIATVMLIDEDAVDQTARYLNVAVSDLPKHHVWICKPDLEGEYVAALGADRAWTALVDSDLFSVNQLANCTITGPTGSRTEVDVATFCGHNNRKSRAAMAIAAVLTLADVLAMKTVDGLLTDACAQ